MPLWRALHKGTKPKFAGRPKCCQRNSCGLQIQDVILKACGIQITVPRAAAATADDPWAARNGFAVEHRADNWFEFTWVTINKCHAEVAYLTLAEVLAQVVVLPSHRRVQILAAALHARQHLEIGPKFGLFVLHIVALAGGQLVELEMRDREVAMPNCIVGVAGGEALEDGLALREETEGAGQIAVRDREINAPSSAAIWTATICVPTSARAGRSRARKCRWWGRCCRTAALGLCMRDPAMCSSCRAPAMASKPANCSAPRGADGQIGHLLLDTGRVKNLCFDHV